MKNQCNIEETIYIVPSIAQFGEMYKSRANISPIIQSISESLKDINDENFRQYLDELQKEFKPV